jgi:hypothetical protein
MSRDKGDCKIFLLDLKCNYPKSRAIQKLFLLLTLSLLLLACSKNGKEDDPSFQFAKGFGSSEDRPEGVPFVWPKGLRLVGDQGTNDEC